MIRALRVARALGTDPAKNLALEALLMERLPRETCVLYLWQNAHTVVVGRNQNAWRECRVDLLRADGGRLVRRPSGGGAVYHDLGNLNFTFLLHDGDYDVARQQRTILRAVRSLGVDARVSGRNDLEADGRKFSGNAFYRHGGRACHHGTLLLDVDMERMGRYLNVDPEKLAGKGVASVRARVVNLRALEPSITPQAMARALTEALGAEYGPEPQPLDMHALDGPRLRELEARFASWDWTYGRPIAFSQRVSRRFAWGGVELCLRVDAGRVADCACYSDAMDAGLSGRVEHALRGCRFERAALCEALCALEAEDAGQAQDLRALVGALEC